MVPMDISVGEEGLWLTAKLWSCRAKTLSFLCESWLGPLLRSIRSLPLQAHFFPRHFSCRRHSLQGDKGDGVEC